MAGGSTAWTSRISRSPKNLGWYSRLASHFMPTAKCSAVMPAGTTFVSHGVAAVSLPPSISRPLRRIRA